MIKMMVMIITVQRVIVVSESDTCRRHLVVGHTVAYSQLGSSEGSNKT